MLGCYLALAFMLVISLTGSVISIMYGGRPRRLRVEHGSQYNRLVVAALHMNETRWQVFYGESSVVNSLLNWPLRFEPNVWSTHWALRLALRALILGQWALALGASALKGWDAYFITFWIVFCIFSQSYLFSPERRAKKWMEHFAEVDMERYKVRLSSRRTLVNAIVALNPDTFPMDPTMKEDKCDAFYEGSMKWIDPILKVGPDRTLSEEATRLAMIEAKSQSEPGEDRKDGRVGKDEIALQTAEDWRKPYGKKYWLPFISEGIEVAYKIRKEAGLSGRLVEIQKQNGRMT
jgi:hypothetical protein